MQYKKLQLSTNIVESDIVLWTKSSQVYYAFDTQNISGSEAYLSISYYNADKKKSGQMGSPLFVMELGKRDRLMVNMP